MSPGPRLPEMLTAEKLAALEKAAVPLLTLAVGNDATVYVAGRHPLGLADTVVAVPPDLIIQAAAQLALGCLATLRGQT